MSGALRIVRPSAHVLVATLDHPPANTLDAALRRALLGLLEEVERDLDLRCVVLTGAGKNFCAGADLREEEAVRPEDAGRFFGEFGRILAGLGTLRVPVIAAIQGPCLGGGLELALSCDLRIASTAARFTASGVNVGLVASFHSLVRLLGSGRAAHLLLTGSAIDADMAERWGVVSALHAPGDLADEALALAARIASRAPLAVEANKRAVRQAPDLDADAAFKLQGRLALELARTHDHKEALRAFLGKRPPRFERR
jgi:enoyl-CoA hydratase